MGLGEQAPCDATRCPHVVFRVQNVSRFPAAVLSAEELEAGTDRELLWRRPRRAMHGCPGSAPCAPAGSLCYLFPSCDLLPLDTPVWTLLRDGIVQHVAFVSGFPCWACVQGSHVLCVCWGCIPLTAVARSCVYAAFSESILHGTRGCPAFGAVSGGRTLEGGVAGSVVMVSAVEAALCPPSDALLDHLSAARQQRCGASETVHWDRDSVVTVHVPACCRVGPGPCSHSRPQDVTWVTDFL